MTKQRTTIVFLHGFIASKKYWRKLLPLFDETLYDCITIDLLGHGTFTRKKDSSYDWNAHLTHVSEQIDKSTSSEKLVLVGHSMGSMLALEYAIKYPDRVVSTILVHPPLFLDGKQARSDVHATSRFYRYLVTSKYRQIGWFILQLLPNRVSRHGSKARNLTLQNVIYQPTVVDNLRDYTEPALVLVGRDDRPIYHENIKTMRLGSGVQLEVIPTGHHSGLNQPELLHRKIEGFIKNIPS